MHIKKGGGSLTLLLVLPGAPATGRTKKKPDLSRYQHLTPELRAKIEVALAGKGEEVACNHSDIVRTEVRKQHSKTLLNPS